MKNLLLAGAAAVAGYIAGHLSVGWSAGLFTGLFAFAVVTFLLWRATSKKLEAIGLAAQARMQAGDVDGARAVLVEGLALGKEQVLVAEQLQGQIGQLDLMQAVGLLMQRKTSEGRARLEAARDALEKSWSRDWRSRALLGVVLQRLGKHDDAVVAFEAASGPGGSEALFWGMYAWALNEAQKRETALAVVGRGLAECKGNAALTSVQEALSNRKRPDFGAAFGDAWYQMFPDQMSQEQLIAMYEQSTGKKVPPGARIGVPGADPGGPRGPARPPKTYPMPRR
jgi:tetratricopeptide (TPR) repeat protein